MNMLTRWNPFRSALRYEPLSDFEDMFRGMNMSLRPWLREFGGGTPEIRMDVTENDDAYQIKADIPGVRKEDIEVSIDGRQVSISAEVKREEREEGKERGLYAERYWGRAYRSFSLPQEVDSGQAKASYESGVLSLTLPKKSGTELHRIKVH